MDATLTKLLSDKRVKTKRIIKLNIMIENRKKELINSIKELALLEISLEETITNIKIRKLQYNKLNQDLKLIKEKQALIHNINLKKFKKELNKCKDLNIKENKNEVFLLIFKACNILGYNNIYYKFLKLIEVLVDLENYQYNYNKNNVKINSLMDIEKFNKNDEKTTNIQNIILRTNRIGRVTYYKILEVFKIMELEL